MPLLLSSPYDCRTQDPVILVRMQAQKSAQQIDSLVLAPPNCGFLGILTATLTIIIETSQEEGQHGGSV